MLYTFSVGTHVCINGTEVYRVIRERKKNRWSRKGRSGKFWSYVLSDGTKICGAKLRKLTDNEKVQLL